MHSQNAAWLNASYFADIPHNEVNWAHLAQQWISMRDKPAMPTIGQITTAVAPPVPQMMIVHPNILPFHQYQSPRDIIGTTAPLAFQAPSFASSMPEFPSSFLAYKPINEYTNERDYHSFEETAKQPGFEGVVPNSQPFPQNIVDFSMKPHGPGLLPTPFNQNYNRPVKAVSPPQTKKYDAPPTFEVWQEQSPPRPLFPAAAEADDDDEGSPLRQIEYHSKEDREEAKLKEQSLYGNAYHNDFVPKKFSEGGFAPNMPANYDRWRSINYANEAAGGFAAAPPPCMAAQNFAYQNYNNGAMESLTSSQRNNLPVWIREGLEKMEREKQKQAENKEEQISKEKAVERRRAKGKSRFESDSEDDLDEKTGLNEASEDENVNNGENGSTVDNDNAQEEEEETEANKRLTLLKLLRSMMTDLLMTVTNGEIEKIVGELYLKKKSGKTSKRAQPQVLAQSSAALATIISLGSENDDSDDDDAKDANLQSGAESDDENSESGASSRSSPEQDSFKMPILPPVVGGPSGTGGKIETTKNVTSRKVTSQDSTGVLVSKMDDGEKPSSSTDSKNDPLVCEKSIHDSGSNEKSRHKSKKVDWSKFNKHRHHHKKISKRRSKSPRKAKSSKIDVRHESKHRQNRRKSPAVLKKCESPAPMNKRDTLSKSISSKRHKSQLNHNKSKSRSPAKRRRSRTPSTKSPLRKRSRSTKRHKSRTPTRRRSKSPKRSTFSRTPERKSRSPRYKGRSPERNKGSIRKRSR